MEKEKKRILIIEDTPEISKVVSFALTEGGFEVEAVSNGTQGIEKIKNRHFDLVLLDLVMPDKSGFEVMNSFQAIGVKTPVIIYSNMSADFSEEEALKMGAKDYIEKSQISLEDLVERVKKITK